MLKAGKWSACFSIPFCYTLNYILPFVRLYIISVGNGLSNDHLI